MAAPVNIHCCDLADSLNRNAGKRRELHRVVVTRWRKKMNRTASRNCLCNHLVKISERGGSAASYQFTLRGN